LRDYLNEKIRKDRSFIKKPVKSCPECGGMMLLYSETKTSEHRSRWECCTICAKKGCGYIEYQDKTVEEIMEKMK